MKKKYESPELSGLAAQIEEIMAASDEGDGGIDVGGEGNLDDGDGAVIPFG